MFSKPRSIVFFSALLILILVVAVSLPEFGARLHHIVISYNNLDAQQIISNSEQLKLFADVLEREPEPSPHRWYGRRQVTFAFDQYEKTFAFDGTYLYDNKDQVRLAPDEYAASLLEKNFDSLVKANFAPITGWSEAGRLFPRLAQAKVTDLETGQSFMVMRRGGSYHADVQPLTAEDTTIMKQIFHGKWTWKRRAIILEVKGKKMAASMNGMPHGQGAIKQNNFPGHFCIHFYDSLTHGSRSRDPAHHLMMLKAGGQIEKHLQHANPLEVARAFLLAVEQQDQYLLRLTSRIEQPRQLKLLDLLDNWADINFELPDSHDDAKDSLFYVIPVELGLLAEGSSERYYHSSLLILTRESLSAPWLVNLKFSPL